MLITTSRSKSLLPGASRMIEKHLLFAVLAFESELLDLAQLTAACRAWAADKSKPLADLLIERGWITTAARGFVEMQLERKLAKHQHDPRVTLNAITRGDVCDAIKEVADPDIQQSLSSWPSSGPILLEAIGETLLDTELPKSRYTWLSEVGKGGRGRVWLARDNDLSREVALKELIPGSVTSEAVRRLIKEAQITGQLQHPNIVPVYEVNRGGRPFYTMKLVKGETLSQAVQRHHAQCRAGQEDPKTMPELMRIFLSICDALAYAHSRGVIHRDLKPRNIVLGEYGEAIVLDWGLARQLGTAEEASPPIVLTEDGHTETTIAGQTLGTPGYMAPEQAAGRIDLLDHRTDIYGLGAILFEILTGHAPHEHRSSSAREDSRATRVPEMHELLQSTDEPRALSSIAVLLHQISTGQTPHVRDLDASIPEELDAICAKAMAKTRDQRYQSAKDLKAALLEFQVHEESIELTTAATLQLESAKQSERYQDYHRALFGFEEALRQWPDNTQAKVGIEQTLIAHGQTTIKHGDIDPRMSLLTTNDDILSEVRTKLANAHRELKTRIRVMKALKIAAGVLVAATLVLLFVAARFQLDFREARKLKELAVEDAKKAKLDTQQAQRDQKEAEEQKLEADKKAEQARKDSLAATLEKMKAEQASELAKMETEKANEKTAKALVAQSDAEAASVKAAKAKIEADKTALLAMNQRAQAEADKMKAEQAEMRAAYKAGLADASRTFFEGNYPATRRKLNQLRKVYSDLCGPEWDLLMNAASAPQAVSMSMPVESISLTRDGRKLVTGDSAGHIVIWPLDADGRILDDEMIRRLELGSRLRVVAMTPDGNKIAAAGDDGLIRVWSLTAAAEQPPIALKGHDKAVNTLKFSDDGKQLASGGDDRTVRLWALDSATVITGKRTSFPVTSLDWSRDGAILVAATRGFDPRDESPNLFRPLRLIPILKDAPPIAKVPIAEVDQTISDVEDEPPGLARAYSWEVVTKDNTVTLKQLCTYDGPFSDKLALRSYALKQLRTRDGPPVQEQREEPITDGEWDDYVLQGLREGSRFNIRWEPTAIALTSDGRFAACNGFESEIYLWQANIPGTNVRQIGSENTNVVNSRNLSRHSSNRIELVRSLAFTPDDSHLLAAGDDGTISIWNREAGGALPTYNRSQVIYGHGGPVRSCLPLPQSPDLIVSGSYDQHIHVLNLKKYLKTREAFDQPSLGF